LCLINFKVTVLAVPTKDADIVAAGMQTEQLATVEFKDPEGPGTTFTASSVTTTTFAGRPMFVIGDKEPHGVNDVVNFWGSQWWKNNFMSGFVNAGYPAFKGYADESDIDCGGTWLTRLATARIRRKRSRRVLVIVTTTVHKDGPNISGDIQQILLVTSDGNYGPAPGHRGGGPVKEVICTRTH
jgi:hypothetical protein